MFRWFTVTTVFCFVIMIKLRNCSRILAVCPRASISHQFVFRELTLALNRRGHEIVFVTSDPIKDKTLKNYTEIDVSFLYNSNAKKLPDTTHWRKIFPKLIGWINGQTQEILENPKFKKIYDLNSEEKFDLILLEYLYWPAFFPLAERFEAPIIGISPMGLPMNVEYAIGNPIMPSHPSNWEFYSTIEPSFYERLTTWINVWRYIYFYKTDFTISQQKIARKHFGDHIPDLEELERNISLIFVNQPPVISFPKPNVPNIITISGFRSSNYVNPLPENLQKILDEATEGFVYMSLGSNMKSTMLSTETISEFTAAFSRLPYKVLWKFENDYLPGKPDNVHIMKWVPQQDVLAHPKLKVFLYQGGLQSTEEAVYRAIPLIGIPTWLDQGMQVDKMVSLGVAEKLTLSTINRHNLENAILTVAQNKSYKENMLHLQNLLKDNAHDLLDNAVWWTEYVIRNKGAPHLRSTTADEPWYRRQDMDVIVFISVVSTIISGFLLKILFQLLFSCINIYNKVVSPVGKIKKSI